MWFYNLTEKHGEANFDVSVHGSLPNEGLKLAFTGSWPNKSWLLKVIKIV